MSVATGEQLRNWLRVMIELQRTHNEKVHPKWDQQGYVFTRAIWIECAELMDHYGWKWWKHQEADRAQVELELVDIWHFGLSQLMITHQEQVVDVVAAAIERAQQRGEPSDFRQWVENLAREALETKFSVETFIATMRALPMSVESLYTIYVAKNVLNVFRQENGYKEGTYRKLWNGREDNEHLAELADSLDVHSGTYIGDLNQLLTERYAEIQSEAG